MSTISYSILIIVILAFLSYTLAEQYHYEIYYFITVYFHYIVYA
jgi:hypothetical protein